MKRILSAFLTCLFTITTYVASAAEPRQEPTQQERARTVYIFHQPIVMLQAKFGLTTPEERVLRIRNTLRNFTEDDVREPLKLLSVTRYNQPGKLIVMNGKPVMLLTEGDLDEGDDLTLDQAAQRVLVRMEAQRTALRDLGCFFGRLVCKSHSGHRTFCRFCFARSTDSTGYFLAHRLYFKTA